MEMQWYNRQLEIGKSLVQQGSQALRQGDFNTANAAFAEATAVLDMAEEDTRDVRQLRAQVMNESGFILQRAGRPDMAIGNHRKAAEICDGLMAEGVEFRSNAAATNINLAGLLAGTGQFDDARAVSEKAIGLAESLAADGSDPEQAQNLLFGANQNYAMILARSGAWEEAQAALRKSMELVPSLAPKNKAAHAQAAQGCQQMSVLLFHEGKFEEALTWGRRAEELSEKAYHEIGEPVLGVYVTSQINLISFHEKVEQFADAESALFKALDVVGNHPQLLLRAKNFYEQCRKLADAKLEAGNLPREEVEESYEEIMERIKEIGGIDHVMKEVAAAEAAEAEPQIDAPEEPGE